MTRAAFAAFARGARALASPQPAATLAGYGAGAAWAAGGSPWLALGSTLGLELDRALAARPAAGTLGDRLEAGADLGLTALALARLGVPGWLSAAALGVQVLGLTQGYAATVGLSRSLVMLLAAGREARSWLFWSAAGFAVLGLLSRDPVGHVLVAAPYRALGRWGCSVMDHAAAVPLQLPAPTALTGP